MRRAFPITGPLDIPLTLRMQAMWGESPWIRTEPRGGWVAERTAEGAGTVHMVHAGDRVEAEAWGPGGEVLLGRVPDLLGLAGDPLSGWTAPHAVVERLRRSMAGFRLGRAGDLHPRIVATVLAQKVTGKESMQATRRMAAAWGESAPGPHPDLCLLPPPARLAETPYYAFHPLGIERKRAELVRLVSARAAALQRAAGLPGPDAMAHLQALPGIGPWTAGVVVGLGLGDPDAVPVGDYNLPGLVAWALAGERRGDDAHMLTLLEPYAGRRGVVVRLLKSGGEGPPRRGPRTDARDIRGV